LGTGGGVHSQGVKSWETIQKGEDEFQGSPNEKRGSGKGEGTKPVVGKGGEKRDRGSSRILPLLPLGKSIKERIRNGGPSQRRGHQGPRSRKGGAEAVVLGRGEPG